MAHRQTAHTRLGCAVPRDGAVWGTFSARSPGWPGGGRPRCCHPMGDPSHSLCDPVPYTGHALGSCDPDAPGVWGSEHAHAQFVAWGAGLDTRAWRSAERPGWTSRRPHASPARSSCQGVTTCERRGARGRARTAERRGRRRAQGPTTEQQAQLDTRLHVPAGARASLFDQWRRAPVRVRGPAECPRCRVVRSAT